MCVICGKPIDPKRKRYPWVKTCSKTCGRITTKKSSVSYGPNVGTGAVGAIHELVVSADLMKRGFNVFRALSPSCPCDLAILRDGKLIRVEVTTGYVGLPPANKLSYPKRKEGCYDLLAVVSQNGIHYFPELRD